MRVDLELGLSNWTERHFCEKEMGVSYAFESGFGGGIGFAFLVAGLAFGSGLLRV